MLKRYLELNLEKGQSAFLWGARKTGKSTYLQMIYPNSVHFDLLDTDLQIKYIKQPSKLRTEILALDKAQLESPIIIDEVQKVPALMDEIHLLIENTDCYFILCGSSARKMKKNNVNMLGGRAIKYNFYPLVYPEIKDQFNLIKIFNNGLLPSHFLASNARRLLKSYIEDYLAHEIKAEGLVRNLAIFSRFLDNIAFSHGELLNYANIARDTGISAKTVKEYYQIVEDTMMGYLIYPYCKRENRRIISSVPKFYFFDVGLANRLMQRSFEDSKGPEAGRSLEHYVLTELMAYISINDLDEKISYWRTHTGLEVDFIIHSNNVNKKPIPIEVKISENLHNTELKGMKAFMLEHQISTGYIVCMEKSRRKLIYAELEIIVIPIIEFLEDLWEDKII
jgi:predicted AAA+ superfamily ATPase